MNVCQKLIYTYYKVHNGGVNKIQKYFLYSGYLQNKAVGMIKNSCKNEGGGPSGRPGRGNHARLRYS